MIRIVSRARRSLARDASGVAMIEFAYALPVVLLLGLGGMETANYALAHLRVSQIAIAVADNASRVTIQMDETNIEEVLAGAEVMGGNMQFAANGRIILSSLEPNNRPAPNTGQMIRWQRCFGSMTSVTPSYGVQGTGATNNSLQAMGAPGRQIASAANTAIMFVEATYRYQPLFGAGFGGFSANTLIRYESALNVRERNNQAISNTTGRAVRTC